MQIRVIIVITALIAINIQPAFAAIRRTPLKGAALGILGCTIAKGGETIVKWRVIVNDKNKPINGYNFIIETKDGERRHLLNAVIPPRVDISSEEIFSGIRKEASISGYAVSISGQGVYEYKFRQPLAAPCD